MEEAEKERGEMVFFDSPPSLSSEDDDESFYYGDSEVEEVRPQLIKSFNAHCTPIDTGGQARERNSTPRLQSDSWASEMSLYDKLSPRKTLGSLKIPNTPAVIPTPQEFKGFNWKKMEYVLDTCTSNNYIPMVEKNKAVDAVFTDQHDSYEEYDEEKTNSYSCEYGDEGRVESPKRLEIVEEASEISKTADIITSDLQRSEPVFEHNNLLVNYIPPNIDSSMLRDLFSPHGRILSCKVVVDHVSGLSKGYGFVKFRSAAEGISAQRALHQFQIGRKTLKVSFSRQPLRGKETKHQTNLYLWNLDPEMKEEDLEKHFKTCGYVVQCKILKNTLGKSKQIGFVRYDNSDSAWQAIAQFNGQQLEGTDRPIKIRIAGTPRVTRSRDSTSAQTFDFSSVSLKSPELACPTSTACYVSGFDVSLAKRVLINVFEPSRDRKVKSIRIIRRQRGPYAFVNFFNYGDAAAAARNLNNTKLGNCTLTVRLQT
jgi:RNA recognition motif-containing protein